MGEKKVYEACRRLLTVCSHCQKEENILIVTDEESFDMGMAMWDAAEEFPNRTLALMTPRKMHGEEPTDLVAAAMLKADVIFRATTFSLSHSKARENACVAGARDLNCCDYDYNMLESGGLYTDFEANRKYVDAIAKGFEGGDKVHITSALGTDYYCSIKGHKIFPQYGMSLNPGQTSSPPDIECATGAIPGTAYGKLVIDGSITHPAMGLLKEPITLYVENSFVTKIEGGEEAKTFAEELAKVYDPRMYRVGEIGVGLNPDATLCGRMLEDEGCMGYVHVALGNNETDNRDFLLHIDMMFKDPTIEVDGKVIFDEGKVVFD
ncbi:MAG: hypothetical protein HFI67_05335 [Lachnospiraceae bacterium]|jgi:leucyl aminopeptidase (aminopeptidase T)|nr:hypothetical protein [Lachnospiraceae bacterium]